MMLDAQALASGPGSGPGFWIRELGLLSRASAGSWATGWGGWDTNPRPGRQAVSWAHPQQTFPAIIPQAGSGSHCAAGEAAEADTAWKSTTESSPLSRTPACVSQGPRPELGGALPTPRRPHSSTHSLLLGQREQLRRRTHTSKHTLLSKHTHPPPHTHTHTPTHTPPHTHTHTH